MEVTSALISMRVELGLEKSQLLENHVEGLQQNFILPSMRMEIRSILKSLEVKSTTVQLLQASSTKAKKPSISSGTSRRKFLRKTETLSKYRNSL
jgi:hypothetical protein